MAPTLKLTYFNFKGRAELSRLVCAAAGLEYEDHRYADGEWDTPTGKAATPHGQVPVLTVDGKQYSQSLAIATYLAREGGLYGSTNLDGLAIDQHCQLCKDFLDQAVRAIFEKDAAKKETLMKELKEEAVDKYYNIWEKALTDNKTGYLVGDKLSLADLCVFDIITGTIEQHMKPLDGHPMLKTLIRRVNDNPMVKEYVFDRK